MTPTALESSRFLRGDGVVCLEVGSSVPLPRAV